MDGPSEESDARSEKSSCVRGPAPAFGLSPARARAVASCRPRGHKRLFAYTCCASFHVASMGASREATTTTPRVRRGAGGSGETCAVRGSPAPTGMAVKIAPTTKNHNRGRRTDMVQSVGSLTTTRNGDPSISRLFAVELHRLAYEIWASWLTKVELLIWVREHVVAVPPFVPGTRFEL